MVRAKSQDELEMEGGDFDSNSESSKKVSRISSSPTNLKKRMRRFLSRMLIKHQSSSRADKTDNNSEGMEFENPYADNTTNNVSKVSKPHTNKLPDFSKISGITRNDLESDFDANTLKKSMGIKTKPTYNIAPTPKVVEPVTGPTAIAPRRNS